MELFEKAKEARLNAYAPYSKFLVGAAIKLKNGEYIKGCNVENSSYGLTICAERNALFQAVSKSQQNEIEEMLVIGDTEEPIIPCGACLQVMAEILPKNTRIFLANLKGEIKETSMKELLPNVFEVIK